MKTIERTELVESLSDGKPIALLEALPPKYFNQGHLPGAQQLDFTNAVAHAVRLKISKDDRVVVYCANENCPNSHQAADAMTSAGYSNVSVYVGGKKDWTAAGLVLEGIREVA